MPLTLGRRTGPSWSTRRSCAWWAGIPWAHAFARSSEAASASRDPGTRSSAWSPIWGWFPADWGGAAYIYRAASAAELDPVVVAVRVAGDAAPLAPRVAALARQVDAGLHLRDIVTLDDIVAQEQIRMVGGSVVFGSVLLVALVFSAAGLYALMAVAVARRTREIGIRIALGANPRRVLA